MTGRLRCAFEVIFSLPSGLVASLWGWPAALISSHSFTDAVPVHRECFVSSIFVGAQRHTVLVLPSKKGTQPGLLAIFS